MNDLLFYFTGFIFMVGSFGKCPHREPDLLLWSTPGTWPGNKKPLEGDDVEISKPILMDESPPPLYNVTITTRGRLVFDPRQTIHVKAANIFVHGAMLIGSEDCLHDSDLKITLTGTRESHGQEEHPKAILVPEGGTLEIHGGRKLSWTKLDGTQVPLQQSGDVVFHHQTLDPSNPPIPVETWNDRSFVSGIAAYTIRFNHGGNPVIKTFNVFDLVSEGASLARQILEVADGEVLMLASQHNIRLKDDRTQQFDAFDALETLISGHVTRGSKLRTVVSGSTYALVYYKGSKPELSEVANPLGTGSSAHLKIGDRVFIAEVNGYNNANNQLDDFKILTYNGFKPVVDVIDDVTSWKAGDTVVFASTDYDWEQAEERTVIECTDCTNTQFRIDRPVNHVHWGEMMFRAVDMRGEVGLLTRNVVIEGEMEDTCPTFNDNCKMPEVRGLDTYGGHIKILEGYKAVHIEGAELRNLGQQTDNGRYPIHFHLCAGNQAGSYIRECSIHNSFSRCVTIHGTNDIQVVDNFCYNHMGHGYFLEDGAELNNTFDGNLAMTTRKGPGQFEPVDKSQPAGFWITNPNTRVVNNVAAGGEGTGIWLIYPDEVLLPSRPLAQMARLEARSTPITQFYNNVGHSNSWVGVHIGSRLSPTRTALAQNTWQPRTNPKDPSSTPVNQKLEKITAYKNRRNNMWIEGGTIEVTKISSSDSLNGIMVTNDGLVNEFTGSLTDSVIIGDSVNVGVPSTIPGRSVPMDSRPEEPHSGLTLWKGPTKHSNLWFGGVFYNDHYDSAAIAMKRFSPYFLSMQTSLSNMLFAFDDKRGVGSRAISGLEGQDRGWKSRDGAFMSGFTLNTSESVFPHPAYITRPDHLSAAAKDCKVRENWRFAVCSTKIGNLKTLSSQPAVFVRHDVPAAQLLFSMSGQGGPQVVLDGSRVYTVHFENKIPSKLVFTGEGMERGDELVIGVCLPRGGGFQLRSKQPVNVKKDDFVAVNSLDELRSKTADDGRKYYHDTKTGMLYYKFIDIRVKSPDEMHPCVDGLCPDFVIDKIKGDKSDADCRRKLYGDALNLPLPEQRTFNQEIPRNGDPLPPQGWGAGSTRPFTSRDTVDGGYSEWTDWSTCSQTCGSGGVTTRTRTCNNPIPANGGRPCQGDSVNQLACIVKPCSIDGIFTDWTLWSVCEYHAVDDCQGTQRRTRTCSNPYPQHGGITCTGATQEIQPCNKC